MTRPRGKKLKCPKCSSDYLKPAPSAFDFVFGFFTPSYLRFRCLSCMWVGRINCSGKWFGFSFKG